MPIRSITELNESDRRERWHRVIFHADTIEGKRFDIVLLWVILLSVLVVMLESVPSIKAKTGNVLTILEFVFTFLFSIEYLARIWVSKKPWNYVLSFWGIIDILSIVPTYLAMFLTGSQVFTLFRAVRLLRVFRILKLTNFLKEAHIMSEALKRSQAKIVVFFGFVLIVVVIMGAIMYIVEPADAGFTSIPRGIYWAIVTITTVGYGDIAPVTWLGQFLSAVLMILGYAVIAVPTGIVSVNLSQAISGDRMKCHKCHERNHIRDAHYCHRCGTAI